MERDPACGMTVDATKAAGQVEHEGKMYYFCAPGCAKKFSANPGHYLQPAATAIFSTSPFSIHQPTTAPAVAAPAPANSAKTGSKIRYTCPMHPEVVQYGPGSCPKCGMALEPMDFAATVAGDEP